MVLVTFCVPFVLALLFSMSSALTIPLNGHNLHDPSNTTLLSLNAPSRLIAFPPAPFRYRILPFDSSQTSIIFTNYGPAILGDDARKALLIGQVIIMREMAQDPLHGDSPIERTRTFGDGSVTVTIEPRPELNHAYLGLWLAGALEAGNLYGFVECEMRFVDERPMFGPSGFTLGTARLGSS